MPVSTALQQLKMWKNLVLKKKNKKKIPQHLKGKHSRRTSWDVMCGLTGAFSEPAGRPLVLSLLRKVPLWLCRRLLASS